MTEKEYTCVYVNDMWHCTQEQANPPAFRRGSDDGAWTICSLWGAFIRGFDKRRPTCKICLKAIEDDELHFPQVPKDDSKRPRKNKGSREEEHESGSVLPIERTELSEPDSGDRGTAGIA